MQYQGCAPEVSHHDMGCKSGIQTAPHLLVKLLPQVYLFQQGVHCAASEYAVYGLQGFHRS